KYEAAGGKIDRPYTRNEQTNSALAFITDPWGTYIELNERPDTPSQTTAARGAGGASFWRRASSRQASPLRARGRRPPARRRLFVLLRSWRRLTFSRVITTGSFASSSR